MKSENFVIIQGWMCNELELKGNDLLVYALIYGFSQDGESKFSGSRNYIANTFNISKPTVDKALQSLLDKGYISKHVSGDITEPNTYWANLDVVKKLYWGSKETLLGDSKETLLNNTSNNTDSKKKNNSKELLQNPDFTFGKSKPKKDNLFTKCTTLIDSYDFSSWGNIRKLLIDYLRYRVSVKDKPLYTNMWKGMLNKLAELCGEDVESYEAVIKQSIERGYLSFYPVSNSSYSKDYDIRKGKPWEEGLSCETYTPEEKRQIEKEREEMEARGVQVWY